MKAKISVILAVMLLFVPFVTKADQDARQALEAIAMEINKQCPMDVGTGMLLKSVTIVNNNLMMDLKFNTSEVNFSLFSETDKAYFREEMRKNVLNDENYSFILRKHPIKAVLHITRKVR